jgi:wyosine [tRNA(Phe)-imidazoG37] synthetase (radical SAM superfamily)
MQFWQQNKCECTCECKNVTLPLETGIIYGPLYSRRLGISLGINLLPVKYKLCSFNCIYCHYGLTDRSTAFTCDDFPVPDRVCRAVEEALRSSMRFDTLTFSGNGEPTLHPQFVEIVSRVQSLRDRLRPAVTLSLYSNASTVMQPHLRECLRQFDNPILKLDCGDQVTFERVNRPFADVQLDEVLGGLKKVSGLIIQTLMVDGPVSNSHPDSVKAWQVALAEIQSAKVQLYSCDYPVPIATVERVLPYVLKRIASETTEQTGIQVEPYWIT